MLKKFAAISAILLLQNCLYLATGNDTVFDSKAEISIKFESIEASNLFYSKTDIREIKNYRGIYLKEDNLFIPFIAFKTQRTFYKTNYINDKIREADINGDALLTLKEVQNLRPR